jgi:hypothetical protein
VVDVLTWASSRNGSEKVEIVLKSAHFPALPVLDWKHSRAEREAMDYFDLAERLRITAQQLDRSASDVLREQVGRSITDRDARRIAAAAGIRGW